MAGGTLYFFNLNNFNSRILYGMRPAGQISKLFAIIISIHAPLTGCDHSKLRMDPIPGLFQSTHPLRDATICVRLEYLKETISIHAPLTGCDFLVCYLLGLGKNFNPRTPYGMRLYARHTLLEKRSISIHAPLTGCDDSVRAC